MVMAQCLRAHLTLQGIRQRTARCICMHGRDRDPALLWTDACSPFSAANRAERRWRALCASVLQPHCVCRCHCDSLQLLTAPSPQQRADVGFEPRVSSVCGALPAVLPCLDVIPVWQGCWCRLCCSGPCILILQRRRDRLELHDGRVVVLAGRGFCLCART